jgi:hypothetical protein
MSNFWLFPKIKSALKGKRFQDIENKKYNDGTGSYSTREVPKLFPTMAATLG